MRFDTTFFLAGSKILSMPTHRGSSGLGAKLLAATSLLAATQALPAGGHESASAAAEAITHRAGELVAAFTGNPRGAERLVVDFEADERRTVDFFPLSAQGDTGATIRQMHDAPIHATHALLREALSEEGYFRVQAIQSLEDVLREATAGESTFARLSDAYAIRLFGEPSNRHPWGMKYQGHHLSLNFTVVNGEVRGTPMFLGANPARVGVGPRRGLRALASQQDLAWELMTSLNREQRTQALQPDLPSGIRRGALMDVTPTAGLPASAMSEVQKALVIELIASYARMLRPSLARKELERVEDAGRDQLRFSWKGSLDPNQTHAYRIQGPTVRIDFENRGGNHVHSLWRDPEQDFGKDLLLRHLQEQHAQP